MKSKKYKIIVPLAVIFMAAAVTLFILIWNGVIILNEGRAGKYPVRGVDVSWYQGDIDWETLAENDIKFVFIKATEGSTERSYRLYLSGDYEEYDIRIRNVITEPSLSDGREWTFWQYTDREVLDGYIGDEEHIDVNVFNGSSEEFEAYLAEKSYKNRDNEQ